MAERERANNRERILKAATSLFAQRGFAAVSQREIASAVGIKAASIYNHFQSKDAILEEIVETLSRGLRQHVEPAFVTDELISLRDYIHQISNASDTFFASPSNLELGIIVMREQFYNATVRRMLYEMMIVEPRKSMSAYFSRLMDAGMMRSGDPLFAAKEYHGYFVYEFYENALSFGLGVDLSSRSQMAEAHTNRFIENWER